MATKYHVYGNDGAGGPIDYTTPVATVAGLSWASPALALGSDTSYAVRAFDDVSGLEERNVDARVRVRLDAAGNDLGARPPAPLAVRAISTPDGLLVTWAYSPSASPPPTGFKVWAQIGAINYGLSPSATVAVTDSSRSAYSVTIGSLAAGTYTIAVRAGNAAGDEPNTMTASVTIAAAGPDPVDELAATVEG
jgi:hypothetical protein